MVPVASSSKPVGRCVVPYCDTYRFNVARGGAVGAASLVIEATSLVGTVGEGGGG